MTNSKEDVLAVIGGGRWGRVITSVLASIQKLPFDRVLVVSKANEKCVRELLSAQQTETPFHHISTVDELLKKYSVQAAIIANSAREHYKTAHLLIENRIHALIEKPVVLTLEDARDLIHQAQNHNVCLVPGLLYQHCSYIHCFANELFLMNETPSSFLFEWSDPLNEIRYGEKKSRDFTINVADDIMPHIWTILSILFPKNKARFQHCEITGESRVHFSMQLNDMQGQIILEREGAIRRRKITFHFNSKKTLTLDFATEPGTVALNEQIIPIEIDWSLASRPLRRQFNYFLFRMENGMTAEADAEACINSVIFSNQASLLLNQVVNSVPLL